MRKALLVPAILLLSFTVATTGSAQSTEAVVWMEDFDSAASVDDLDGWIIGDGWTITDATESSGSGRNSLESKGNVAGHAETAVINLSRLKSGELRYLARRTNTFPQNALRVLASIDGGLTYSIVVADTGSALGSGGNWRPFSFPLSSGLAGAESVRFRFETPDTLGASPTVRIDDIAVVGEPYFYVEPPSGLFAALPGDSETQMLVLYNNSDDPLAVGAPVVSDAAFAVSPAGAVVVPVAGSVEYEITFAPEEDGTYSGDVIFDAGPVGRLAVPVVGLTAPNVVSFTETASSAGEGETGHEVGLSLGFLNEDANLQGIQIAVSWDADQSIVDVVSITDVAKGAAVNHDDWTLSYSIADQSAAILLFDNSGSGLPVGHYPDLLKLVLDVDVLPDDEANVTFSVDEVIGALAVPTADDAGLIVRQGEHQLQLTRRAAFFGIDVEEIDFGAVEAGQTFSHSFNLTNTNAARNYTVYGMDLGDGTLTVSPDSAVVQPGDTVTVTVTFAPSETDFGLRDEVLTIYHNAAFGGVYELPVRALGTWGRGDNDGDGMVDAMDIVNTTDFILGRDEPTSRQLSRSDLYPFADGDGELDIRDLSVTVQAIVRNEWPDGFALPPTYELPDDGSDKRQTEPVFVSLIASGPNLLIEFETSEPLRALQLHLQIEDLAALPELILNQVGAPTASAQVLSDDDGNVRILLYRPDGGSVEPGSYRLARIQRVRDGGFIMREYATAVDGAKKRLPVVVEGLVGTPTQHIVETKFEVGSPYPNPIRSGSVLRVALQGTPNDGRVRLEVFDLLGRRIDQRDLSAVPVHALEWDVRHTTGGSVAPGVYLLRISSGDYSATRKIVVVR